jgi:hypothetical protein
VTALPPVVSLLAAFGANVPPPLPAAADFLAMLTAAEESVPSPAPDPAAGMPDAPRGDEQKATPEKPKKAIAAAEPPPLAWVSVPIAPPQEAPPAPMAIELPFSQAPIAGPEHAEVAEIAAPPPALSREREGAVFHPEASPDPVEAPRTGTMTAQEAPEPAAPTKFAVEEPVATAAVESAPPEVEELPRTIAPSTPRTVERKAPRPKQPVEAPPAADADVPRESAPPELAGPPAPCTEVAATPVEGAAAAQTQDVEAPSPPQERELRAKAPLAFSARLVTASPKHADTKVSATAASAPAPEPQRRAQPHAPEEVKGRAVRAPDDSEIVSEGPREQPSTNTPPPRELPAQDAPERADTAAKADAPKPAVHAAAAPADAPKASPIARDIRLEVAGGDRKVELRVIERAGEVQVAVRTPDERLAGTLRENLPQLSSRLEQSGFRADQWRAADAGGAERRLDVQSPTESSGRAPEHHGGNEQQRQQQEERRPQPADERRKSQEKGTAFEWLMQSLR